LAAKGPEVPGDTVAVAFVDQGYTGEQAAQDAQTQHRRLAVVKLPKAKHGFGRLPQWWVVERSHAWATRFHRLARDGARLADCSRGSRSYGSAGNSFVDTVGFQPYL